MQSSPRKCTAAAWVLISGRPREGFCFAQLVFLEKLALGKSLGVDEELAGSGGWDGMAAGPGPPSCVLVSGPQKEVRLKIILCWGPYTSFLNKLICGSPELDGDRNLG